jgi:hypothetical protein
MKSRWSLGLWFLATVGLYPGAARTEETRLWAVDSLTKVLQTAKPPTQPGPVHLDAARGEVASGQVVFRPGSAVKAVRAETTSLNRGSAGLPAGAVRLQWLRFIDVKRNSWGIPADELVAKAPCALPDPFWDRPSIDVAAGRVQPLWIEIDVPRDAAPGEYAGVVSVRWDGGQASLPIRLMVWDFDLPAARHQQVTNWFPFPGEGYKAAHDSPEYWALAAKFAKIMVAHRQTCFKAELGWVKTVYDPKQGYRCDFRFLDRWAETFFAAGMDRMELFQAGASTASVDDPAARVTCADLAVETPPGVALAPQAKLEGVLGQLEEHIRHKKWTGRVMLHISDEPFLHSVASYRRVAEIVHRAAPSVKIIEAIEATGFGNAIDVQVPKLNHLNLWLPHFQAMQREGRELWFYTCCHPLGRYPNRFLDQPLVKTRALHWLGYLYGLDGYLHWGLSYIAEGLDPYSEEGVSKGLPLGDRAIMYPGRDGPVGSLRWSAMRDGLEDYEYLWVLQQRLAALKKRVGDGADWLDPRQRPLELCRRVVTSFYEHTRQGETLLAARREIAGEIGQLRQTPLLYVQTEPPEGTAVPAGLRLINVRGVAEPGATVKINGATIPAPAADGTFAAAWFLQGPEIVVESVKDGKTSKAVRAFRLVD